MLTPKSDLNIPTETREYTSSELYPLGKNIFFDYSEYGSWFSKQSVIVCGFVSCFHMRFSCPRTNAQHHICSSQEPSLVKTSGLFTLHTDVFFSCCVLKSLRFILIW